MSCVVRTVDGEDLMTVFVLKHRVHKRSAVSPVVAEFDLFDYDAVRLVFFCDFVNVGVTLTFSVLRKRGHCPDCI